MNGKLIEKLVSAEIRDGYTFSRQGIVTNPGKFEGESIATLYYYDCFLNGGDTIFDVSAEEAEAFDIESKYVYLAESNDGFVSLEFYDFREDAEKRDTEELEDDYQSSPEDFE